MRTIAAIGYADAQHNYVNAGWTPLPLPRGSKFPPPSEVTGAARATPTDRMYKHWAKAHADGNVALVMPEGVIGIDIDAYHGGTDTFRARIKRYGSIPNTVFSTSRTDGSGIHFYRVPAGTELVGKLEGGIEIIQLHHRYAVVWPSIHPEGRMYQWHDITGRTAIPAVWDLPELPVAWLNGLAVRKQSRTGHGYGGGSKEWFEDLSKGFLPLTINVEVRRAIRRLDAEGGRYDTMVETLARLVGLGANGYPVGNAINGLFDAYVAALGGERDAESEFDRALEGAISKFGAK